MSPELINYWTGGHELSKTTGNAGARVGCGNCISFSPEIFGDIWIFPRIYHDFRSIGD